MTKNKTTRNSPKRILEIIEAVCQNPESATAQSLSRKLDIPSPTIYRWLDTLCEENFIAVHAVPGERFRDMIISSLQYEPKVTERRSILRALSEKLDETVNLSIPHGAKLIYFDRLESHWPFQVNLNVGAELPLHCCASGKLYLSTLEPHLAMDIFNRISQPKSTKNTITSALKFEEEIKMIRQNGYSIDNEEWFDHMIGAAVPILADNGTLIGSLSTHALSTRKSIKVLQKEIPLMLSAVADLKNCLTNENKNL
jgi:IclR family acetate operon transcriptional repressor